MVPNNRHDEHKLIAALFLDLHKSHGTVFNTRALRNTLKQVDRRIRAEGLGFLTKTLPRLGKAFDKALSGATPLTARSIGFRASTNSELPRFLGEFLVRVLHPDGTVLQDPCAVSVGIVRQVTYWFYKYELPYTEEQEQDVVRRFKNTETDILASSVAICALHSSASSSNLTRKIRFKSNLSSVEITREARRLLYSIFQGFDFTDIVPRHGPGAVATRQRLWDKFRFTNVSSRITSKYPLDAYYFASVGHVCDALDTLKGIGDADLPARVVLVPKDSRGPRLISCEPVDFQWIQQGIMRSLVEHIESHYLTRDSVRFTDQRPNQYGALLGSISGRYATLDLNEASDRVSLDLVRLLFPPHVYEYLESVRSSSTVLPNGKELKLNKFAPMGSALCFPILALTVWSILAAAAPDADTRECIYVYGDDVIVTAAYAEQAIEQLESFGLKINRDKSCTKGFFRESCGMDAFKGVDVTPVRFRTVWSESRSPEVYASWIAYANSMYRKKYFNCYENIVGMLFRVYGAIPDKDMVNDTCPSLIEVPEVMLPKRSRFNRHLQKRQFKVWDVKAPKLIKDMPGWLMLLRFFTEAGGNQTPWIIDLEKVSRERNLPWDIEDHSSQDDDISFSVREYTKRRASMLVRRWR